MVLVTENLFHCGFLVSHWVDRFSDRPNFPHILIRGPVPSAAEREKRLQMHRKLAGRTNLDEAELATVRSCYPSLTPAEEVLLKTRGVPQLSADGGESTAYLGEDLNAPKARSGAESLLGTKSPPPWLFVFLDALLDSWWLEHARHQVVNAHSAVLPHARGMYALERLAARGDAELFARACGATVHFVDEDVDTGPIIRAMQLRQPFAFDSIWAVKAQVYLLAFELLADTAAQVDQVDAPLPVGILASARTAGPNFGARHFTPTVRQQAIVGYENMVARTRQQGPKQGD